MHDISLAERLPVRLRRWRKPAVPLEVTFLGTAAASSIATGPTAAQLLRHGDTRVLVDSGRGVAAQLRRAGTDPAAITTLLLTHWHPDHIAGLAQLLSARRGRGFARS
jgi:ribonuclease BN (tRNA processing enzyme)